MILIGKYNHQALIKCGAKFVRDELDGNTYVEPDNLDISGYDPMYSPAPNQVTMRQARLALLQQGLLAQVDQAVASSGQAAQIEWEFSSTVERNKALVQTLQPALGLTDTQLDDLFKLAATL